MANYRYACRLPSAYRSYLVFLEGISVIIAITMISLCWARSHLRDRCLNCVFTSILFPYRDGTVFGCGSTKHGQLPYLKFASPSEDSEDALDEHQKATDEITQATRLKLPILQVSNLHFFCCITHFLAVCIVFSTVSLPRSTFLRLRMKTLPRIELQVLTCRSEEGKVQW